MDLKILGKENDFEKATDVLESVMNQYQEEQNRLSKNTKNTILIELKRKEK